MTIKEIKAMFTPGQKWAASRTGKALVVNGNLGQSVIPANNVFNEPREVIKVGSRDIVWKVSTPSGFKQLFTEWPKASQVLEARAGYLKFQYDNDVTVELSLDRI